MTDAGALAEPAGLGPLISDRRERRRRFYDLIWIAATTEFRRRYIGSVLGYAWTVLQPLLLFAVLYAIFTRVVRFGGEIPDYEVMLLLNIVFYFFFREATVTSMRSFVAKGGILRSVRVPALAMPLAAMLTAAFVFACNLVVGFTWALGFGVHPRLEWLLLPALIAYLLIIIVAVGVLLSAVFVRVRDVAMVWLPVNRLLFYASGVIFPFEMIPEGIFRSVAAFNPLCPLFVQLRAWLVDEGAPQWPEAAGSTFATYAPFICLALICVISFVTYRRTSSRIAENL